MSTLGSDPTYTHHLNHCCYITTEYNNHKKFTNTCLLHVCLICNQSPNNLYNLSPWSQGGWATAVSWLISIIVGLSAVLWTLLVVLWESQLQLGFFMMWQKLILWLKRKPDVPPMFPFCGINWSAKGTEDHILLICKSHWFSSFSS